MGFLSCVLEKEKKREAQGTGQEGQGAVDAKNNKANTKLNKNTKFNTASEWEEVYGLVPNNIFFVVFGFSNIFF